MRNRKFFCLDFETEISEEEYEKKRDSFEDELEIFKPFKKQMVNSNLRCKKCKKSIRDMVLTDILGCPSCYNLVRDSIFKGKFSPSLVSSGISRFFMSVNDDYRYRGKRPEYAKKYFDMGLKVADLKRELKYSIEQEDYIRCDSLKKAIDDMEKKMAKVKRSIDE